MPKVKKVKKAEPKGSGFWSKLFWALLPVVAPGAAAWFGRSWLRDRIAEIWGFLRSWHLVHGWVLGLLYLGAACTVLGFLGAAILWWKARRSDSRPRVLDYVRDSWFGCVWVWRNSGGTFGYEIRPVCPKCSHPMHLVPDRQNLGKGRAQCPDDECGYETVLPFSHFDASERISEKIEQELRRRQVIP